MELGASSYPIIIGRDILKNAKEYFRLDRKVFIVTDDGVPKEYALTVKDLCKDATVMTVKAGEGSKSISTLEKLLFAMSDLGMTRGDCVVAVGGGVVGDLAGFAASVYMRGIDFYNVPTTLLSQVDSSIGGKTAVNLGSVKNSVGSFKQPKAVIVDVDTLKTLPERHLHSGLCEAVKMAATSNKELFEKFEASAEDDIYGNIEEFVTEALKIKKAVVEVDECEKGLRKILNFGHTLGHGIEAEAGMQGLYHGECVALGMLPMCADGVRERLIPVLTRLGLPTKINGDVEKMLEAASHDKKCDGDRISVVWVEEVGSCQLRQMPVEEWKTQIRSAMTRIGKD